MPHSQNKITADLCKITLEDKAKEFIAQHGITYDGDFYETYKGEQIKFAGIAGRKDKICWLKCHFLDDLRGLNITFGVHHPEYPEITSKTIYDDDNCIPEEERKAIRERRAESMKLAKARAEEEKKQADKKADWCLDLYNNASEKGASFYLERKGIAQIGGIKYQIHTSHNSNKPPEKETIVLVPFRDIQDRFRGLQKIYPTKRLIGDDEKPRDKTTYGSYTGCFHTLGTLTNGCRINIAEGFATAATIFLSTNQTTLAVFSNTNIANVVKLIQKRYPKSEIVICGDDDKDSKGNPGRSAAEAVAKELNCKVCFPVFPAGKDRDDNGTAHKDFNDLMLVSGKNSVKDQVDSAATISSDAIKTPDLTTIEIIPGDTTRMANKAEEGMISRKVGIYQRAGRLVRVVTESTKPNPTKTDKEGNRVVKRDGDALVITEVDHIYLTEILGGVALWVRFDERTQQLKQKDCPEKIARTLIARRSWRLPVLTGIIQAPTLRPDGSILERPGYDEETGFYFDPGQTRFPPIPTNPTKEDAEKSLGVLLNVINEFPFENNESRSVALSAILTAIVRKSIRTAPLHGFTAPKMSSGKSLLADVVGLIATGKINSAIPHAENEAEEKKRLLAVLAEGDPVVCFDNIERPFGSAALCSVLSQTEYKDRVLGSTRNLSVLTNTTILATGNNLTFVGDISTRAILCRLDPLCERPEERTFKKNLYRYIPENRGEIVAAALTILRAYHIAGRPKQDILPFGRFEEWSDLVRAAIVWLGQEDPCTSRKEIESADPVRVALGCLLSSWHEAFDDFSKKLKDVIKDAENKDKKLDTLHEALMEIAPDNKGGINSRSLGKKLSSYKGRIEGGYRLECTGTNQGVDTWRVTKSKE